MASDDIQILRVTADEGDCIVFACLARTARCRLEIGSLGGCASKADEAAVVCDCTALVQITDAGTLMAMSAWIMSAATWLTEQQSRDKGVQQ